jgi:hypothetical protein
MSRARPLCCTHWINEDYDVRYSLLLQSMGRLALSFPKRTNVTAVATDGGEANPREQINERKAPYRT